MRSSTGAEDINIGGTRNVLRAMESTGASHFVFTSSTLAYGPWPIRCGSLGCPARRWLRSTLPCGGANAQKTWQCTVPTPSTGAPRDRTPPGRRRSLRRNRRHLLPSAR
ncbi:NAD-dependent epimerase/dehydratase family protein [Mycobacterium innocens]|uniref:NAD-dependent epimerase/dehydratase family protein n=1 Tax=Mycobacterium innocens TaxID=2341083 RepID=UPI003CC57256